MTPRLAIHKDAVACCTNVFEPVVLGIHRNYARNGTKRNQQTNNQTTLLTIAEYIVQQIIENAIILIVTASVALRPICTYC